VPPLFITVVGDSPINRREKLVSALLECPRFPYQVL
jgi:hypothetical protein